MYERYTMLINIIKHVQHASCHKDKTRTANEIKTTNRNGNGMRFSFAFPRHYDLMEDSFLTDLKQIRITLKQSDVI